MNTKIRKINQYYSMLDEYRYYGESKIENIEFCPCDYKTGELLPAISEFTPYTSGTPWGNGYDTHAWFHLTVDEPKEQNGDPFLFFVNTSGHTVSNVRSSSGTRWDAVNPQFIIYVNGKARQGFDVNHTWIELSGAEKYDIYLYAYTGPRTSFSYFAAYTCRERTEVTDLIYDIAVPRQALDFLDPSSREYAMIVDYLDKTVSLLDLYNVGSDEFFASVSHAKEFIREEFYGKYCGEQPTTTACIGHTHIDCAWLWTLRQSREKVQRSFGTVLELMRRYPEYKFTSSQALLYKYLKEESPEIYEGVREMIKAGRFECEGSMWVEADCNLSSGESLVRQVMYGKRFFSEEFGVENRILWLPDVFGYSAALPQILKKSGVDWFVTSKISWNDTNVMPYETFYWRGIDGTEINTYFMTACNVGSAGKATYNGKTDANMLAGTYKRYTQKALSDEAMLTYGYGDGGGGPTAEMIEFMRRGAKGIPGVPNAKPDFAGDFLCRLEKKIEKEKSLPVWQGELYLEYHRGTYTSMAKNKKNNRDSEFLLCDAELLACEAAALCGDKFPKAELHAAWEDVLTNQFHDIIPGSSIREVYEQCDIDYANIRRIGNSIINGAKQKIAGGVDKKRGYVVFNPHSFEGKGYVKLGDKTAYVEGIPSKGYAALDRAVTDCNVKINGRTVESEFLTVKFDEDYLISSVYDKRFDRELLIGGERANRIEIYPDYPDKYDNWEWQEYSLDEYTELTAVSFVEEISDGARRGFKIVRPYGNSEITQNIWFYDKSARIDFETHADWHETHKMVKAAFPIDINADMATYDVQFGNVTRPTHKNTSWDRAKFEVCAHKYADLSDSGYGASLMNDCKYGYDIHNGTMRLSLFKCGTYPNEVADQGDHDFTYSLYLHGGKAMDSDVIRESYYLNYPMTAVAALGDSDKLPTEYSFLSLDKENVVCETVKQSEDGEDTVVRLYESKNMKTKVKLKVGFEFSKVCVCDMLEREQTVIERDGNEIALDLRGFEIVTLKFKK